MIVSVPLVFKFPVAWSLYTIVIVPELFAKNSVGVEVRNTDPTSAVPAVVAVDVKDSQTPTFGWVVRVTLTGAAARDRVPEVAIGLGLNTSVM